MKRLNGTRPKGNGTRPRTGRAAGPSLLYESLAAAQDALARRAARRIRELLDGHIPVDALAGVRARIRAAAATLRELPDRWAARVPEIGPAVMVTVTARIEEVLAGFLPIEDVDAWAEVPPSPGEQTPTAQRSRTWAEARGQNAALRAALLDVRARIVSPRRPIPSPSSTTDPPPLVPRALAESRLVEAVTGARTQIEGLPSRVRSKHPSVPGAALVALEDEVRAALTRLADGPGEAPA